MVSGPPAAEDAAPHAGRKAGAPAAQDASRPACTTRLAPGAIAAVDAGAAAADASRPGGDSAGPPAAEDAARPGAVAAVDAGAAAADASLPSRDSAWPPAAEGAARPASSRVGSRASNKTAAMSLCLNTSHHTGSPKNQHLRPPRQSNPFNQPRDPTHKHNRGMRVRRRTSSRRSHWAAIPTKRRR